MSLKVLLLIGSGSFIGGVLRYLISFPLMHRYPHGFPWGTFAVNLLGCLLIGFLYGLTEHTSISKGWRLFLVTGILGGFTTFSAFSNETVTLVHNGYQVMAVAYVVTSMLLGIGATFFGVYLARLF